MQLFYATRDGQSRRIAERIAGRLAERGIRALPHDLAVALPAPQGLAEARLVVVVAAVRYGRHLPEAEQFLAIYRALRAPPPLVLLSVNLTARKPGKDTAEGNAYLRKSMTPAPAYAGPRLGHCRTPGLLALWLAGPPVDPLHHEADGRADRSQLLHGILRRGMWLTTSACG